MQSSFFLVLLLCTFWLSGISGVVQAQSSTSEPHALPRDSVRMPEWTPHPFIKGAASMALAGDRTKPGLFAIRVKYPHGLHIPPHNHINELQTTVLSGMLCLGFGKTWDTTKLVRIMPGQFMRFAPGEPHFEYTIGETILHIQGIGPMLTTFIDSTAKAAVRQENPQERK